MTTITLGIAGLADGLDAFSAAWKSEKPDAGARISFSSPELLWMVLTAKRWAILQQLTGQGPIGVRELARRVGRDVKRVHNDIQSLIGAGLLLRAEDGKIEFPYDSVHVDFVLASRSIEPVAA
jgi:predicted transcriptional regulator